MNKIIISIFLFLFIMIRPASYAQALSFQERLQQAANEYLQLHQKDEGITAVTLSVYSPKLLKVETVVSGYTDNSSLNKIDANNLYQIGSITKSFISVILLQLEAENTGFNINDKLGKYLPQYTKWKDITVKQLLNMTSGIPSYTEDKKFWQDFANHPYHDFKPQEIVNYVYEQSSQFNPGKRWHYNNTGYILAGMIIERITGRTLKEEINNRFIKPGNSSHLTLNNTLYLTHYYPVSISQRMVHGYIHKKKHAQYFGFNRDTTNFTLTWAGAAGAITSTPADVLDWTKALYTSTNLLPEKQRKELTSCVSMETGLPVDENKVTTEIECFGLGIGKLISPQGIAYTYEGSTIGYRAVYLYVPSTQIYISTALNSSDDVDNIDNLIDKAYSILN